MQEEEEKKKSKWQLFTKGLATGRFTKIAKKKT